MKTTITLLALLISGITLAQAEITTGFDGFETWTTAEAGELPEFWDGFNKNVIFGGMTVGSVVSVEKSDTDPYEGTYSAKLTNTSIMGGPAVPGILTTGDFIVDWNAQDGDVSGGEAYTQLPTMLNGQFKYVPSGVDTGFVAVWFLQNGVEVGRGRYEFDFTAAGWTEFNVSIDFDAGAAPDSMNIMFSSSKSESVIPEGSVLEIDAISFASYLSVEDLNQSNLRCYPNPAHEKVTVEFKETTSGIVRIISSNGACVRNEQFTGNSVMLETQDLPAGIYQLIVQDDNSIRTETIFLD